MYREYEKCSPISSMSVPYGEKMFGNHQFEILADQFYHNMLTLATTIFLILVVVISTARYKNGERSLLLVRHITGFLIGLLDQILMVVFNFQPYLTLEITLFDYSAYTFWYLVMPASWINKNITIRGSTWVFFSACTNTVFEHISWFLITTMIYGRGFLPYPTEPIRWTSIHTFFFYLAMHSIATCIILLYIKLRKNSVL